MPDKSSIYWLARALADEKRANRIAGQAADEIKSMYRRQYLKIVKQITALKAELDKGKELTRTQLWNYGRWRQLEAQLQAFVDEATRMQTETIHTALEEVFESTIGSAAKTFDASRMVLPVDPESVINTSWSGQNYSARVWHNQAAIADRMKHNMEDMFIQGKNLRDMKKALMHEFDVAFNDADRLVRTEAAYVLNRANITRYKSAGIAKVRWSTGPEDGDECVICAARSNKVYLIADAPMIPAHPRCRCIYAGVVEIAGENVPVDGPDADRALEIALAEAKKNKKSKKSN